MSRTSVSTRSPAPRSKNLPARGAIAACCETRNALGHADPVVAAAFEHRTRRCRKMRIGEGADGDAIAAGMVCGLPIDRRAATRTEMESEKTSLDAALINTRG